MIAWETQPKTALEDLTFDLVYGAPGLPGELAVYYLRRTAIEMCREADLARRRVTIETQDGVDNYRLEALDEVDLVAVIYIKGSCGPVRRLNRRPERSWPGMVSWLEPPDIIWIRPGRSGACYEVECSVAPQATACEIDTELAVTHYDVLLAGAQAMALAVPGKPWSDLPRAGGYRAEFMSRLRDAQIHKMRGRQRGLLKVDWGRAL